MVSRQNLKTRVWRFISWTPADLFYSLDPISSNAYAVFHSKILRSNLKLLFINIVQIGVLLDMLFVIPLLIPLSIAETLPRPSTRRVYMFAFTSVVNVVYHITFLLLRHRMSISKYQMLISGASLVILYYLINQYQLTYHSEAPVEILMSIGLLQMLVAVFYCQGSFVCSMVVWIICGVWVSSGDTTVVNTQVISIISAVGSIALC